jgi:hypothetical protein
MCDEIPLQGHDHRMDARFGLAAAPSDLRSA